MWQNSNSQMVTKLKIQIVRKLKKNGETQIVTKLEFWQYSNCDKTKNLKIREEKTQIVTRLKKSNCDKT